MTNYDGDWRSRGACLDADPELFFPLSASGPAARQITRAKLICGDCGVRAECLEFALGTNQMHGVWGGASEDERRLMAGSRRSRSVLAGHR